jgi:hypothetical protein
MIFVIVDVTKMMNMKMVVAVATNTTTSVSMVPPSLP